jgi:Carboxypeptidase regulatory-like domain
LRRRRAPRILAAFLLALTSLVPVARLQAETRTLSGVVVTKKKQAVEGVTVVVRSAGGEQKTVTDADGNFRFVVPANGVPLTLLIEGRYVAPAEKWIAPGEPTENLELEGNSFSRGCTRAW